MKSFILALFVCILFTTASFPKEKIKVALIDTGISLEDPRFKDYMCPGLSRDFTGTGIEDNQGHGTNILGIIQKYTKHNNYCFIMLKYYNRNSDGIQSRIDSLTALYLYLEQIKPEVVNYSGGGDNFIETESLVIKDLSSTKFFVAAGNEHRDIDKTHYYPASLNYSNVIAVGALDGKNKASFSNWGKNVIWKQGVNIESYAPYSINYTGVSHISGTSQATAVATSDYLNDNY